MNEIIKILLLTASLLSLPNVVLATEDEALDSILLNIEVLIEQSDTDEFDRLFNFNKFMDRALDPLTSISKTDKRSFRKGLMDSSSKFSERILRQIGNSKVKQLKVRKVKNTTRALYRIDMGESGYSYLEFILRKTAQSRYEIVDWYSHVSSQYASTSVRQLLVFAMPNDDVLKQFLNIVSGDSKEIKNFMKTLAVYGKTRDALPLIKTFESSGRHIKANESIAMLYLLASSQTGDETLYKKALKNFAEYHGDNPRFAFAMVDYYFYSKKYDEAIQALNRFEKSIRVADPAIYFLRGNVYLEAEEYAKSIQQTQQAIKLDPNFEDAYWTAINSNLGLKQFEQAIVLFKVLESRFDYIFTADVFVDEPLYVEFIQSNIFKKWINK